MEKDIPTVENDKACLSISIIRELLHDDSFKNKHRTASKFFSPKLKLDFITVVLLVLQKSTKPLQLVLNKIFKKLNNSVLATKSAFTQARSHLKATAFITLNKKAVLDVLYNDDMKKHGAFAYWQLTAPKSTYLIHQILYKNLEPSNSQQLLTETKK